MSRTLSGLFLVGALNRPRKRKRDESGKSPEQIRKIPEKSGKSQKGQKGQKRKDKSRSGNPPPVETPPFSEIPFSSANFRAKSHFQMSPFKVSPLSLIGHPDLLKLKLTQEFPQELQGHSSRTYPPPPSPSKTLPPEPDFDPTGKT